MTHKENRAERSRLRAEEHRRVRQTKARALTGLLTILVGAPLIFYGGIEYGWWHPVRTPEFREAIHMSGLVLATVVLYLILEVRFGGEKKPKPEEPATPAKQPSA